MLEVAQPSQCNLGPDGTLDASTKVQYGCDFRITVSDAASQPYYRLADCGLPKTRGLIDPFSNDEFDATLRWYPNDRTEKASARFANQNMILAIGAQCAPSSDTQVQIEQECLAVAQSIASSILLESPSLQGIQTFLLLAYYMLGACRRNAAFMYLGVAARAAHALGLHNAKLYESLPANSVEQQ
jgi:hypothetical protein